MNKILLIIRREYFSRVKKKSFILMTLLGPLLIAGLVVVMAFLAVKEKSVQRIQVIDDSRLFHENPIRSTETIKLELSNVSLDEAKDNLYKSDYTAILWIPQTIEGGAKHITFFYKKPPGMAVETHVRTQVEQTLADIKLIDNHVDIVALKNVQSSSRRTVKTVKITENGQDEETNTMVNMGIGYGAGIIIYLFIFLYGVQVMRGVIEEKTNRIVEVIISSVKPFQLMLGKITGIALVGLTQFLLWIILTGTLVTVASFTILKPLTNDIAKVEMQREEVMKKGAHIETIENAMKNPGKYPEEIRDLVEGFEGINFLHLTLCFLFYFLGGYLMYSSLFAAVGAAVDNETDSQQFMIPLTLPLILAFSVGQILLRDPESPTAFWFSIIPFTSPVVMMMRLPFGVAPWELALSMSLLVIGFLFTTWLAGRIYRTGILMYGKKPSYRELWKWLFYKG